MTIACLEHVNTTVKNPDQLATVLCDLFGWTIRWSGDAMAGGYTVHVGSPERYLALYTHNNVTTAQKVDDLMAGRVNHIGVVVDDSSAVENRVIDYGLTPMNHRDYGVCKSFYFMADQDLEVEVVCYQTE